MEHRVLVAQEINTGSAPRRESFEKQQTTVWRLNWKVQIGYQKLKELLHSETQLAMCGRDARSLSKEKGNAAIYIQALRLVTNQWRVTTLQSHRDSKVMTWNRRKPLNQRSCFLFRIEGYGRCRHVRRGDAETLLLWSLHLGTRLSLRG
jgi:hypothetical protein